MPPKPFRVVRLPARSTQLASAASKEKSRLLTYSMALAQPTATVPLLSNLRSTANSLPAVAGAEGSGGDGGQPTHALDINRRWVRDADELCIASIRRSSNINKINSYVATYKFEDPHWRPFLLPDVQVVSAAAAGPGPSSRVEVVSDNGEPVGETVAEDGADGKGSASPPPPPPPPPPPSPPPLFDVHIDYNKLMNVELLSRHANFSLRHLVQKGHAMYFVNYSQHSVLEMRGLVEASYITCAYGIRGERLRTHMTHVGPLDVRDVVEIDPATGRVAFNLKKKNVRKGVVAVSLVEGYGTWFHRKPMLWQRTRRIGALQSQMGAFDYQLCPSEMVGRVADHEVSLLEPHLRTLGAGGGAEAVGIVASSQVAQNDRLYLGQFEAPVITALDAVHQLTHRAALHNHLVRSAEETFDPTGLEGLAAEEVGRRRRLAMERMLPVSWVTRTPPPYVPLEADLPFRLQISRPSVFHTESGSGGGLSSGRNSGRTPVVYPTGGTVGSPMVKGVPLSLFEYNLHQGVDHYIYDDSPSSRPTKWWSQKSNMPYNGYLYCMRSGLLDYVVPAETLTNPLAPPSAAAHRRSSDLSQEAKRERRRRLSLSARRRARAERRANKKAAVVEGRGDNADDEEEDGDGDALDTDSQQQLMSTTERWRHGESDLAGHDDAALAAEASLLAAEEEERYFVQRRPPLSDIVPPTAKAAERAARYEHNLLRDQAGAATTASTTTIPGAVADAVDGRATPPITAAAGGKGGGEARAAMDPAEALLRRQLQQRALRRKKMKKGSEKSKGSKE